MEPIATRIVATGARVRFTLVGYVESACASMHRLKTSDQVAEDRLLRYALPISGRRKQMKSLKLLSAVLFLGSAAHASSISYYATLSGANEIPVNASTATGSAIITVDNVLNTIDINVTFSGLSSVDTAAHIHCCQPLGINAGV